MDCEAGGYCCAYVARSLNYEILVKSAFSWYEDHEAVWAVSFGILASNAR